MPLSSRVLDNGLTTFVSEADKLYICNAEPTTFTEATSTFALGNKNFGAGNVLSGPSGTVLGPLGRRVTVAAITNGVETASGTATWWAIVDSANSRLLATDALDSSHSISGSTTFTLPSFDINIPFGLADAEYFGPGDVVSGATAWVGLRAYSLAAIGSNAIRLRRDSDNTEQDFVTLSTGALDLASIETFRGTSVLYCKTLYDQTGNGFHATQTTASQQPIFLASGLNGQPALIGDGARNTLFGNSTVSPIPQPYTINAVCLFQAFSLVGGGTPFGGANFNGGMGHDAAAKAISIQAGGSLNQNARPAGVWYAINGVLNGASSVLAVNGTETTGNAGSNDFAGGSAGYNVMDWSSTQWQQGHWCESGVWPLGFSAGQRSAMNSNQTGFWNFATAYQGPDDVLTAGGTPTNVVIGFWGLRSFSAGRTGSLCARLRRSSDNAEQDFIALGTGGIDTASITSWAGGSSLFIKTLYDGSGFGNHLTQTTQANQPAYTPNAIGSLPSIDTTTAGAMGFATAGNWTSVSQPFTLGWVGKRTSNLGQGDVFLCNGTQLVQNSYTSSNNTVTLFAGSSPTATASDNAFHSIQMVYNGASSDINVDGSVNTVSPGTNAIGGAVMQWPRTGTQQALGHFLEGYFYFFGFSSTQSSNVSSNQHSFWGY